MHICHNCGNAICQYNSLVIAASTLKIKYLSRGKAAKKGK
jgi:hypothetical protein